MYSAAPCLQASSQTVTVELTECLDMKSYSKIDEGVNRCQQSGKGKKNKNEDDIFFP